MLDLFLRFCFCLCYIFVFFFGVFLRMIWVLFILEKFGDFFGSVEVRFSYSFFELFFGGWSLGLWILVNNDG